MDSEVLYCVMDDKELKDNTPIELTDEQKEEQENIENEIMLKYSYLFS